MHSSIPTNKLTHGWQILGKISLANISASRQYLLSKTQHRIGGFSKFPGDPPGEFISRKTSGDLVLQLISEFQLRHSAFLFRASIAVLDGRTQLKTS